MAKILIADDDAGIVDAVSLVLEEEGHSVHVAQKEQQIYSEVSSFQPDVLLLDILMSGSDGRVICRRLKDDPKTQHIPIIMFSAHPSARVSASQCGADDFLAKPFEVKELLKTLQKHLK